MSSSTVIRFRICQVQRLDRRSLSMRLTFSKDIMIVPLTSKTSALLAGEFVLIDWSHAGLNVESAVKRGLYTLHESLVAQTIGQLSGADAATLEASLRDWLELR